MVRLNPMLASAVRIMETAKMLVCGELARLRRALSAEATAGLSPSLIIHDELAASVACARPLYEALETAVGAQEAPLSDHHFYRKAANDSPIALDLDRRRFARRRSVDG